MRYLILLLTLLYAPPGHAAPKQFHEPSSPAEEPDNRFLGMEYGDMTVSKFTCNRNYLAPEIDCSDWRGRVAVTFNLSILRDGFWRNYVHGEGTASKFETMGWQYELGTRLPWGLEFGAAHHSQHRLDDKTPQIYDYKGNFLYKDKFPVEDSYFLRMIFFDNKN